MREGKRQVEEGEKKERWGGGGSRGVKEGERRRRILGRKKREIMRKRIQRVTRGISS